MKFLICYITVAGGERTERYAQRFTASWRQNPPGYDAFELHPISNGNLPSESVARHFNGLNARWLALNNEGHDIGAYIKMAWTLSDDTMLLCLGQSVYFHRPGWLARLNQVCSKHGPGMYGFYASNLLRKHLNTTAFCVTPSLLRGWNQKVETKEQRYDFEHGPQSFWRQVELLGFPVRLVTWDYDEPPIQWRSGMVQNEFWRGDQSQCLMWCGHTDRWANAVKATRTKWTNNCDRGLPVRA